MTIEFRGFQNDEEKNTQQSYSLKPLKVIRKMEGRSKTRIEESLELEKLDENLYRSVSLWMPIGARGVFGGQILSQALAAASKTVGLDRNVHSVHGYFLYKV
jgi:hypothetical protein